MQAGATSPGSLSRFGPYQVRRPGERTACGLFRESTHLVLRQRTANAETTPSRGLGAGVVVRMRENADLALIRPVEASVLVGGLVLGWDDEYRRLRIGNLDCWSAVCAVSFPFV